MRCLTCSGAVPDGSRYCPFCAAPVDTPSSAPTETRARKSPSVGSVSGAESRNTRFLPGTVLARRYRIVGLLGRGGMGEVYRADDLKLGQPVALKFLPEDVQRDEARLSRFLNEVRVALRVTHPNVCRVHDIGEVGGQHYLSMEYVDGEDLASLLRRIGRLPQDKAVQIARQLCAGLAAAHEQGILHRDLKPANVMIDGRGRAKITDFGLAELAQSIDAEDVRAGTPLYMAPEQREGREVTVRSDLYSLGLVLYELFTGRRAFEADTRDELIRLQQESTPTSLTSHVDGLDVAVERIVLRCLEKEPHRRPAQALSVAAALPGGDPLAAALAAGETPPPEMVADAGEAGGMAPWIGAVSLAVILGGLACVASFYGLTYVAGRIPFRMPPEALAVEARRIIELAGHSGPAVDRVYGFEYDDDYFDSAKARHPSPARWEALGTVRPSPVRFWYRESPEFLLATDLFSEDEFVTSDKPPWVVPGMVGVRLDPRGQLLRLRVVPPRFDESAEAAAAPDWDPFFEAAQLDPATFTPTRPQRNPLLDCDERWAWNGVYADRPDLPVRVEAGSYRGKPAYFEIVPAWTVRSWSTPEKAGNLADAIFYLIWLAVLIIGGPIVARHNLRQGRGDRRGAKRVAGFVLVVQWVWWVLGAHHVVSVWELWLVGRLLAFSLVGAGIVWVVYIALEPYARRTWPAGMISWSRLIAGRFRDPLIGRDIVIGALAGVLGNLIWPAYGALTRWMALPADALRFGELDGLVGVRQALGMYFSLLTSALYVPIGWLFVLLLLTRLLRRRWAAVVFAMLFATVTGAVQSSNPVIFGFFLATGVGIMLFTLTRFGLVAGIFWAIYMWAPAFVVLTTDPSAWYAGRSFLTLLLLAVLAGYGFWISQAGRPRREAV